MDLLSEFDRARDTFSELGHLSERFQSGFGEDEGEGSPSFRVAGPIPSTSYDLPSLTADVTLRQAARYHACWPWGGGGRGCRSTPANTCAWVAHWHSAANLPHAGSTQLP